MFSNREFQNSDFINLPYRLGGAKRPGRDGRFQVIDDETNLANLHPSNPSSSLKQTDGIPTRLFSTSTVAIQRSRKTWPPKPRIKSFSHWDLPPWHSYVPGPEWAGCPGSVVLIDVHGNYELRCSQKCHTSTEVVIGEESRWWSFGGRGYGAIPTIPIHMPRELILRIHHTIHIVSFLKLLTRWTCHICHHWWRFHVFETCPLLLPPKELGCLAEPVQRPEDMTWTQGKMMNTWRVDRWAP